MLKTTLRSTTSLALCLSLAVPPAFAQDDQKLPICGEAVPFPCVTDDDVVVETAEDLLAIQGTETTQAEAGTGDGTAEADATVDAEAEATDEAMTEEAPADTGTEAETEAETGTAEAEAAPADDAGTEMTEEAAPTDDVDAEAMEQATTEAEATADTTGADTATDAEATADTDATADTEATAEPDATADTEATAEPDATADTEATAEPDATDTADTDATDTADTDATDAVDTDATDTTADSDATADTDAMADTEATAESDATADTEAADDTGATAGTDATGDDTATDGEATADTDETTDETTAETDATSTGTDAAQDTADTQTIEKQPEATAAAAAGEGEEAEAEVTTEEVTEETSRSSDEEFDTTAAGDEATEDDDDEGLSNFQKALIVGLGAVAVGSILSNGDEVVSNTGDRVVVRRDNGDLQVLKDDDVLLRQPGNQVQTETFSDGSTRTTVTRDDGLQIVTIRAADGRVLRRTRVLDDGTQVVLFDDTAEEDNVDVASLPAVQESDTDMTDADEAALRQALLATQASSDIGRTFSLRQVRDIREVRSLAPQVELDAITFASGSAAIQQGQAEQLANLGLAISDIIRENPGTVFLVEGHTDAVGDASYNLALSDRRAESVALALTEYFDVPPENLVTQGYGESALKIQTEADERANRRAAVRNITSLLR